jgi:hypothetical protein
MNIKVLVRGILVFDVERILNVFVVAIGCHYVRNESYTSGMYVYLVSLISKNIYCLGHRHRSPQRPRQRGVTGAGPGTAATALPVTLNQAPVPPSQLPWTATWCAIFPPSKT